jgi:hypothetical protein
MKATPWQLGCGRGSLGHASFRLTRILSLAILEIRFGIVNEADGYVIEPHHLATSFVHLFDTMIWAFVQCFLLFFIHARV